MDNYKESIEKARQGMTLRDRLWNEQESLKAKLESGIPLCDIVMEWDSAMEDLTRSFQVIDLFWEELDEQLPIPIQESIRDAKGEV